MYPISESGLDVLGHTGIGGTLALTGATVATVAAGEVEGTGAGPRVHGDGLLDDEAIGNELADRLAGVGIADLADLAGIEPDLALADAEDGRRKPLLGPQINPARRTTLASWMNWSSVRERLGAGRGASSLDDGRFPGSCWARLCETLVERDSVAALHSRGRVSWLLTS